MVQFIHLTVPPVPVCSSGVVHHSVLSNARSFFHLCVVTLMYPYGNGPVQAYFICQCAGKPPVILPPSYPLHALAEYGDCFSPSDILLVIRLRCCLCPTVHPALFSQTYKRWESESQFALSTIYQWGSFRSSLESPTHVARDSVIPHSSQGRTLFLPLLSLTSDLTSRSWAPVQ